MVPTFQLSDFIERVKDKDFAEIIISAERELSELDRYLESGKKGVVKARQTGASGYRDDLGKFLFFLNSGTKPGGISKFDFQLFRPVCENLVKKGQFLPTALDVFGETSKEEEA